MKKPQEYLEGGIYVVHSKDGNHALEGKLVTIIGMISGVVPYIKSLDGDVATLCGKANLWLPENNKDYKTLLRR